MTTSSWARRRARVSRARRARALSSTFDWRGGDRRWPASRRARDSKNLLDDASVWRVIARQSAIAGAIRSAGRSDRARATTRRAQPADGVRPVRDLGAAPGARARKRRAQSGEQLARRRGAGGSGGGRRVWRAAPTDRLADRRDRRRERAYWRQPEAHDDRERARRTARCPRGRRRSPHRATATAPRRFPRWCANTSKARSRWTRCPSAARRELATHPVAPVHRQTMSHRCHRRHGARSRVSRARDRRSTLLNTSLFARKCGIDLP